MIDLIDVYIGPPTKGRPGKWRILSVLGEGGMAAVYEAEAVGIGRRVAIKVVSTSAGDPQARFDREARILGRIQHPNVVDVLDAGQQTMADGSCVAYIVMERLIGSDLDQELAAMAASSGPNQPWQMCRTIQESAAMCGKVMHGLTTAHCNGVVHRDVKPSNIFLVRLPDGSIEPMLIDFGIAGSVAGLRVTTKLTADGSVLGTPHYMALEQLRGEIATPATDCFSLASVLYELITGRVPYSPPDVNQMTTVKVMYERRRAMEAPGPDGNPANIWVDMLPDSVPEELRQMFRIALHPDPAQRYQDSYDMAVVLYKLGGLSRPERPTPTESNLVGDVTELLPAVVPASGAKAPSEGVKVTSDAQGGDSKGTLAPTTTQQIRPDGRFVTTPRLIMAGAVVFFIGMFVLAWQRSTRSTRSATLTQHDAATLRPTPTALVFTDAGQADVHASTDASNDAVAVVPRDGGDGGTVLVIQDVPRPNDRDGRHGRSHERPHPAQAATPELHAGDPYADMVSQCCSGFGGDAIARELHIDHCTEPEIPCAEGDGRSWCRLCHPSRHRHHSH